MSKKNNTVEIAAENKLSLQALMEQHTNVTLAKLSEACDVPYAAVRAKSKQPIEGAVYDASAINWSAIEGYILKKKPELSFEQLPWSELNVKTERATKVLKDSAVDFSVGKRYYLRYFKSVWELVYVTETHVCMMPTDGSTQPKVMAKSTFIACGVKPEDFKPESKAEEQEEA